MRAHLNRLERESARRKRVAVLSALGDKCNRCGFSDTRALQIHHTVGSYREDKKVFGTGAHYYRNVLKLISTGKYELLCANCHAIETFEQGSQRRRVA
jgi:hypothetical protein